MSNVIRMPGRPPGEIRKDCIFRNRSVQITGESGEKELYPCIVLYETATDIPIHYTGLERYLCHLAKGQMLDGKTLEARAYAVCHFLNYLLWETDIRSLHECTLDTIRDFLKSSRRKQDGEEYNKDTWLRYRDYLTDFLVLYHEYNQDSLPFRYTGTELRTAIVLRDEQSHRKVAMVYPASLHLKAPRTTHKSDKNAGITPAEICAKSGKKIWWRCKKGHSWQAPVISRTNLKAGCPICAGQRTLPGENDLATLRPDLVAEWHPSKNRDFKPSDCTISSGRKVWWRCKEGHEWQSVVSARTGKDSCGCPYCYGRYAVTGVNDLEAVKPELALEWHPTKNKMKPSQILPNSNKKAWWLCPECGYEWRTLIPSRSARGSGCPRCAGRVR